MRKYAALILLCCVVLLAAVVSSASAETLGFGFVNNTDVALRRGIGGKTIVRLPKDTCVWIKASKTDGKGVLWYEINAGLHIDHANVDYTGWMKAEFVDAGDAVWHDVLSVDASYNGMVALRNDHTIEFAGTVIAPGGSLDKTAMRGWINGLREIQQAMLCEHGLTIYAADGNGVLYTSDSQRAAENERFRLIGGNYWVYGITEDNRLLMGNTEVTCGWTYPRKPGWEDLPHVVSITDNSCRFLMLMDDGSVFVSEDESGDTEAEWSGWTDIVSLEASLALFTPGSKEYHTAYAAVRKDGTLLAAPEELASLIGNWSDMAKIVIGDHWVLGLKQDGTVLSAGFAGAAPPDVSGWTGITDIGTGCNYCVGVRADGSVAFAGEYVFMREGRSRK